MGDVVSFKTKIPLKEQYLTNKTHIQTLEIALNVFTMAKHPSVIRLKSEMLKTLKDLRDDVKQFEEGVNNG